MGPGDTGFVHNILYDDSGHMAYHSAVHDSFGYLLTNHKTGPGYDYLKGSTFFSTDNCLAGQIPGIAFWKKAVADIKKKRTTDEFWRI